MSADKRSTLDFHDFVLQHPNSADRDCYRITFPQREVVGGNDAGASQEHRPVRKTLAAKKECRQVVERALDQTRRGLSAKDRFPCAGYVQFDVPRARLGLARADANARAQRTGAAVNLGLGKVKKVLSLDVPRAHIVADAIPRDLPARIEE